MTADLLQVRDLKVAFKLHGQGLIRAVDGVSFRVQPGRTVALVGESGSGKSVISQAIMGILPRPAEITAGEILFHDPVEGDAPVDIATLPVNSREMRAIRGGRISMIFQEPMTSLSPLHTVGDQIGEAVRLHQAADRATVRERCRDMLERVGFPDPDKALSTYPFELSGGLRQRAMIAMALVCRPALLVADEPTTALDVTIQAQIIKLIQDLQADLGMAVLLITHDLGVVANMADEVVVIYHGRLMESGRLQDIFEQPRHPYLKALMRAVPRMGMAEGERLTPIREVERDEAGHFGTLESAGPGHQIDVGLADVEPADVEPGGLEKTATDELLSVRGIGKSFAIRKSAMFDGATDAGAVRVLDDVSLSVARGECLGLVGESGCGKTTLAKIIMRALDPDEGDVIYHQDARPVSLLSLDDRDLVRFRRKAQYVFQDPVSSLNPRMTVFDIVSEPLIIHHIGDAEQRAEIVKELMRHVGLDPRFLSRYPHSFSGGQRQRIGIARALALNPELLICDEPVSALDVSVQAQVLNLLKDLQRERHLTYLFVSHNLAVVDYMADRIAVMCAGQLVEVAPREILFRDPVHPYTRALLAAVPRVDPNERLDLGALMEGKVSNPAAWPPPFRRTDGVRPQLVDVGAGHYVRAIGGELLGQ